MSALSSFILAASLWLCLSVAWAALVASASTVGAQRHEGWSSYWLAWLILAVAPPIVAPIFFSAPVTLASIQVDAALALAEWTAPVQRTRLGIGIQTFGALLVLAFAFGAAKAFVRLAAGLRSAAQIRSSARPVAGLDADADVLVAEGAPSAFCLGGPRPSIIVSRAAYAAMSQAQLRLVVRHELAHLKRGDPLLFAALAGIEALFWFNPFVRRLTDRIRLAAEISCDALALEHDKSATRKDYASALVRELERGAPVSPAIAAFGSPDMSRARLAHILRGCAAQRRRLASAALLVAVCLFALPSAALAASTARMAAFGDATLLSALETRVAALYGAPECQPGGFGLSPPDP